jgi:hypothetical protein
LFPRIFVEFNAASENELLQDADDQLASGLCIPLCMQRDLMEAGAACSWSGNWDFFAAGFVVAGTRAFLYVLSFEDSREGAVAQGFHYDSQHKPFKLGKRKHQGVRKAIECLSGFVGRTKRSGNPPTESEEELTGRKGEQVDTGRGKGSQVDAPEIEEVKEEEEAIRDIAEME